jgi:hypothetical protein
MAQGFIDPQSDFAAMVRKGAAVEWGKRAVDLAQAAGQSVDAASLVRWLDQAELADTNALRATNPVLHQERYDEAAAAAQEFASVQGIWRT